MPRRHLKNRRLPGGYHLYNQGAKLDGKRARRIFIDREDKRKFLSLLARHLGTSTSRDERNRPYMHLRPRIVLLAFCIMGTHFHLIVWQRDARGIELLMGRVKADYTRYFNAKYGNDKPLFNGPVQAKRIDSHDYFKWLVGYVHKNHPRGDSYEFSSHTAWIDEQLTPGWLDPAPGMKVFGGKRAYLHYLSRFQTKREIDEELAHRRTH